MEKITSLGKFISEILKRPAPITDVVTYRGHENFEYRLQPSILRKAQLRKNEHTLVRELVAAHPEDFKADTSALELLVRMQHYALPTRLLDVTFNPLVALYFATAPSRRALPEKPGRKSKKVPADGDVVIMSVAHDNMRYFDSDTVSCLSNLARLSNDLKSKIDPALDKVAFNTDLPVKRLVHFIRQEKSGFEPEIEPSDISRIVLVKPKQNNRRILAQAGASFVFGCADEIAEPNDQGIAIARLRIDAESKGDIRRDLDKLGINEKTLFPEIDRAARYLAGSLPSSSILAKIR